MTRSDGRILALLASAAKMVPSPSPLIISRGIFLFIAITVTVTQKRGKEELEFAFVDLLFEKENTRVQGE
jgi:hypothetical protein